jgi:hypothetical protein
MVAKSYKAPDSDDEERHYLVNMRIQSRTTSILAARKCNSPHDYEIILDTGANGSLFKNPTLATEMHREDRISFNHVPWGTAPIQTQDGLYVHDTREDCTCLITTIADNEARYSEREVNKASDASQLQRRLANPPDAKLIKALTTGTIQKTTITPADVARVTDIYGPSIEALKGRTNATLALPSPRRL